MNALLNTEPVATAASQPLEDLIAERQGALLVIAKKYARHVEDTADVILDAWLIAKVGADLTGSAECRRMAEALEPLVQLLVGAEIADTSPLSLPTPLIDYLAGLGLRAPGPIAPPKPEPQTFAQGVAAGRKLERLEIFKRSRNRGRGR